MISLNILRVKVENYSMNFKCFMDNESKERTQDKMTAGEIREWG